MPGGYENSGRRETLSPLFFRLRPIVLERDGHKCQWIEAIDNPSVIDSKNYSTQVEIVRHDIDSKNSICGMYGNDVDHINSNEDVLTNLRTLCSYHHDKRSSKQGNDARWKYRTVRDSERHSGIVRDE